MARIDPQPSPRPCPKCQGSGLCPWPRGMSRDFYSFVQPGVYGPMVCPICDGSGEWPAEYPAPGSGLLPGESGRHP